MDASSTYKLLEQVGNGSFGVVYKAVNKSTGEVLAIKEVRVLPRKRRALNPQIDLESGDDDIAEIQQEITVLSGCDSSHITKYYGTPALPQFSHEQGVLLRDTNYGLVCACAALLLTF